MSFTITRNDESGIQIELNFDNGNFEKWKGKKAKVKFSLTASATEQAPGDPLSYQKVLLENEFVVTNQEMTFNIPAKQVQTWLYKGHKLKVFYQAELFIPGLFGLSKEADVIFDDSKYFKIYTVTPSTEPQPVGKKLSFWKTFLVMGIFGKILAALSAVSIVATAASVVLNPFLNVEIMRSLAANSIPIGIVSVVVFAVCLATATNYMRFEFLPALPKINRDSKLRLGQLIHSEAKTDLHGVSVEVVGHVNEKYKYVSRSSKSSTVRAVTEPANYISIFNEKIDYLPKGASLEGTLSKTIEFDKLYDGMIPSFDISPEFGVNMSIRIHVRSAEYPDKYVDIPMSTIEPVKMLEVQEKFAAKMT